jgi:hypothetical protein
VINGIQEELMAWKRIKEVLAILLIGDGIISFLQPRRHTRLWSAGPSPYRQMMRPLRRKPVLAQAVGVALVGAGLWLVTRQKA